MNLINELEIISELKKKNASYKTLKPLSQGSTAYTLEYDHEELGKRVIKIAKPSELLNNSNQDINAIFIEEIKLLSEMRHRNIVTVYNLNRLEINDLSIPYYEMEYFPYDLVSFLSSGDFLNMSRSQFIDLLREACEGLNHLHNGAPECLCHGDMNRPGYNGGS